MVDGVRATALEGVEPLSCGTFPVLFNDNFSFGRWLSDIFPGPVGQAPMSRTSSDEGGDVRRFGGEDSVGVMNLISGSETIRTFFSEDLLGDELFSGCETDSERRLRIDLGCKGALAKAPGWGTKTDSCGGLRPGLPSLTGLVMWTSSEPMVSSVACGESEAPGVPTSTSCLGARLHSPALFLRSRRKTFGDCAAGELDMTVLFRFTLILMPR